MLVEGAGSAWEEEKKVGRTEELTARVKTSKNEKVTIYYQSHSIYKKSMWFHPIVI